MLVEERNEKTKRIIDKIEGLPVLPLTVKEIISLTAKADCTVNQIADAIDPSLAIKILQVANSPYYRRYTKVKNLEHAISLLGFNVVRDLALGISLIKVFPPHRRGPFDYEKFWQHSLLIAGISKILAKASGFHELGKVYTVSLIHNMGKIVVGLFMPDSLLKINALKKQRGLRNSEAEKIVLGMTHAEIGGDLAKKWKLPEDFIKIIKYHNQPEFLDEDPDLIKLCQLINCSARIVKDYNFPNTKEMIKTLDQLCERLVSVIKEMVKIKEVVKKEGKIIVKDWKTKIHSELEELFQTVEGIISVFISRKLN